MLQRPPKQPYSTSSSSSLRLSLSIAVLFLVCNLHFSVCVTRGQFHHRSMCSFYKRKLRAQLFCAYILGLYFTGIRLLVQKLRVER